MTITTETRQGHTIAWGVNNPRSTYTAPQGPLTTLAERLWWRFLLLYTRRPM